MTFPVNTSILRRFCVDLQNFIDLPKIKKYFLVHSKKSVGL